MSENEGLFKKCLFQDQARQLKIRTYHGHGLDFIIQMLDGAKKELEEILSADMPDFQKLLAVSSFKNEYFGEK